MNAPAVSPSPSRRLAAVLIADVVGYSRLMERNETDTHTRLVAVRAEVTDPAMRANNGRIVRTVGDGLLAEFGSATDALRAATAIQREMQARNAGVPAGERIEYRIGINLGDVIVTPDDIEGDGVNLAARLQTLAAPGGICVSQAVQEQRHEDLGITFVDAGEQRVKNLARPVRVYQVVLQPLTGWQAAGARLQRWRRDAGLRGVAAGLAVLAVGLAITLLWWRERAFEPPRLSVAALRFATLPADAQNAQLAAALDAELRSHLGRLGAGGLFSVANRDVAAADPRAAARELNVRHVLTGTLRRDGDGLEVQAQLVDGETGAPAWSDQFTLDRGQMPRADRLAAARLSAALRLELLRLEARRAEAKAPPQRDATDLAAMAFTVIYGPAFADRGRLKDAGEYSAQALSRAPDHVLALTTRVDWLMYEAEYLPSAAAAPLRAEALALARRATTIAPNDSEVWASYASALETTRDHGPALEAIDRSLKLDPVNVNSMLYRGRLLMLQRRFDEALAQVRAGAELAPQVQDVAGSAAFVECQILNFQRRYGPAIAACERAMGLGVDGYSTALMLSALYSRENDMAKAQVAKARVLKEFPDLHLSTFFEDSVRGPLGAEYREMIDELKKLGFAE